MKDAIKKILHDMNKSRDQMNCCYTCISQDLRIGETPQKEDITDLKQASLDFTTLIEILSRELERSLNET